MSLYDFGGEWTDRIQYEVMPGRLWSDVMDTMRTMIDEATWRGLAPIDQWLAIRAAHRNTPCYQDPSVQQRGSVRPPPRPTTRRDYYEDKWRREAQE